MTPLSLGFLSDDLGLGILKDAQGIVGSMWGRAGKSVQERIPENRVKTSDNQTEEAG